MIWASAPSSQEEISIYGVISLVLMLVAGALVVLYTFRRANRSTFRRARQLPLEGDSDMDLEGKNDQVGEARP